MATKKKSAPEPSYTKATSRDHARRDAIADLTVLLEAWKALDVDYDYRPLAVRFEEARSEIEHQISRAAEGLRVA